MRGDEGADEPAAAVGESGEAIDDPADGDAGGEAVPDDAPVGDGEPDAGEPDASKPDDGKPDDT